MRRPKWKIQMRQIKVRRKRMLEKICKTNSLQNKKTNTLKHGMNMTSKLETTQASFKKISQILIISWRISIN